MTENMGKLPSGHGQITKIWPSDRCGGKTIPTAMQFGCNLREFRGYLGNVGLIRTSFHNCDLLPDGSLIAVSGQHRDLCKRR